MYDSALELGEKRAVDKLLALMMDKEVPKKWRTKAYEALAPHVDFIFNPDTLDPFKTWWDLWRDRSVWRSKDSQMKFAPPE
jgi:hypothetical protein